ncbi:MAG TPA: hydantoinase/oxoprolinase family protein, partial [Deferrisomatales bacterium]|nr:hydantoinase/oxoprolinase family protein [Deferrisomatales bacterium]
MRIGVDVGGTFTDVVFVDQKTGRFEYAKTPTTHHDLARGVLIGLGEILATAGVSVAEVEYVIHGTTIGTNAIVEGKGARVGLITTAGFEDVLEIRRVARPQGATYDFQVDNPPPLVPRSLRKGVEERVGSRGEVVTPLDEASVEAVAAFFREDGVEAVSVSLLFSFLNPEHETQVRDVCARVMPDVRVSLSSEVCPEFREYERTCTTVMNSYLGPVIARYFDDLSRQLRETYGPLRLHIMQSNGGSMTVDFAKDHCAHLINSGPAGGAIATAYVSRLTGNPMAIGADMGGTTFDISIIDGGMPKTTTWGGVTDYPIKLPMVDLKTIGAGGGSIAWVDEGGILQVGPRSAGSEPGPACYGWGGTEPTVSDANCVLGRLNPGYFLGGKLPLYPDRARQAIETQIARRMHLSVEDAALGIIRIANANMAKGISGVSVERGYDLRDFALVGLGGAVALHIVEIAEELTIGSIVLPPMSGNLSALGMVVADIQHDYVRTLALGQEQLDPAVVAASFRDLEDLSFAQLLQEGVSPERIEILWSADMRYEGQSWELNTPVPRTPELGEAELTEMIDRFHSLHQQTFSYSDRSAAVECINVRVRAFGRNLAPALPQRPHTGSLVGAAKGSRPVYFGGSGYRDTPIYERDRCGAGAAIRGPCIIEEKIST